MTSPSTIPQFSNCVTSCAKCDEFEPFVEWHLDSFVWCSVSACDARRGLQDHDSQHGDSLAGARIETAPAVEHSAIKPFCGRITRWPGPGRGKNAAQSFKTQELCNSLWKVDLKEASFSEAVQRLVDRVASGIDGFPTQDHGNLLWLVARPPCSRDSFVRAVVVAVQARLSEFGVTRLSASLWSLANLSLPVGLFERCPNDETTRFLCYVPSTACRPHRLVLCYRVCLSGWSDAQSGKRAVCRVPAFGTRSRGLVSHPCGLLVWAIDAHDCSNSGSKQFYLQV